MSARPWRIALALVGAGLVGACAHLTDDETVCPEYRALRCVGTVTCTMDRGRGCRVCQCDPLPGTSTDEGTRR